MRPRERGFALIAALLALVGFSAVAYDMLAQSRATMATARAELERARLGAAADAGLVLAVNGLSRAERNIRLRIDGRARSYEFDGVRLTTVIEDERGKIPLNLLSEREAARMFEAAGANAREIAVLTDAFLDWRDDDDDVRPNGAETAFYAAQGYAPRNGDLRTVEELIRIRGMTPALYGRIAPAATVFFGESGGFSTRNAQPLALAVMTRTTMDAATVTARRRELAGDSPLATLEPPRELLLGRPLTVRVVAETDDGARLERSTIIELTGNRAEPVWYRQRD